MDDASQLKRGGEPGHEQGQEQEDDEEEEEFDGGEVSGIQAVGGAGVAGKEADHDEDLGGVVMLHDEMVAANRRQELPEASQRSIIAIDITVRLQPIYILE